MGGEGRTGFYGCVGPGPEAKEPRMGHGLLSLSTERRKISEGSDAGSRPSCTEESRFGCTAESTASSRAALGLVPACASESLRLRCGLSLPRASSIQSPGAASGARLQSCAAGSAPQPGAFGKLIKILEFGRCR